MANGTPQETANSGTVDQIVTLQTPLQRLGITILNTDLLSALSPDVRNNICEALEEVMNTGEELDPKDVAKRYNTWVSALIETNG